MRWLITEFCDHNLFNGWHLYLRDSEAPRQRNADGSWGWLRDHRGLLVVHAHAVLAGLGIAMRTGGDGSCDDDGYAEIARQFPIARHRIGGRPRGGVPVVLDGASILLVQGAEYHRGGRRWSTP